MGRSTGRFYLRIKEGVHFITTVFTTPIQVAAGAISRPLLGFIQGRSRFVQAVVVLHTWLILLVLFGANLTAATFGFGGALFAMPLLTLVVGLKLATPLYALVGITNALLVTGLSWRVAKLALVWRLIATTLIGIPLGVGMVQLLPTPLMTKTLGGCLVAFGLYRLLALPLPTIRHPGWAYPVGLVAGLLGGAYNTNGPPVVVYAALNRWDPETFRATLQAYFLATGFGIVASHGLGGLWTRQIFVLYPLALPGTLLAVWLGGWLNRTMPVQRFERLLFLVLIGLGVLLMV